MEVEKGVWKERVRKNASVKGLGSRNRTKRRFYAEKVESVLLVEGRKRESTSICERPIEKGVYLTF